MARICLHTLWSLRSDFIGGTERLLIELSKELKALGHDPFVVCSNLQPQLEIEGVTVFGRIPERMRDAYVQAGPNIAAFIRSQLYPAPASDKTLRTISSYAAWQLEEIDADIVHLNIFSSGLFLQIGKPVVVSINENERELDTFWHPGAFEELCRLIRSGKTSLSEESVFFTPSRHYADEYSRRFGRPVGAIPLGVCLTNFEVPRVTLQSAHLPRVLVPSRFYPPQKGQDLALAACRILLDAGSPFQFHFTGVRDYYQPYVEAFRAEAETLGVSEWIRIAKTDDMRAAYDEADVVASPERYCSWGLSVSESLSLGIPTALSDIPTYREIGKGCPYAFFFASGNATELAERIVEAMSRRRTQAQEMVDFRTRHDLRQCAKAYSAVYRNLLRVEIAPR